jgi:hypothetical protein
VEFTGVSDKYAMHRLVSGIKAVPPGAKQDNSPRCEWIVVVTGSVRDDDKCKVEAIIDHVRILSGDLNITFKRVEAGSIRLTLEGSEAALERLQALLAEAGGSITVGDHTIVSVERGRAGAGQESRPRGGGMLTCKQFLEALNDFLAGTVDPEERESLQRHIDQCPNCWVVVDTAARTVRAYGEMGDKGPEGTTIEEALERALRQGVDRKNR